MPLWVPTVSTSRSRTGQRAIVPAWGPGSDLTMALSWAGLAGLAGGAGPQDPQRQAGRETCFRVKGSLLSLTHPLRHHKCLWMPASERMPLEQHCADPPPPLLACFSVAAHFLFRDMDVQQPPELSITSVYWNRGTAVPEVTRP